MKCWANQQKSLIPRTLYRNHREAWDDHRGPKGPITLTNDKRGPRLETIIEAESWKSGLNPIHEAHKLFDWFKGSDAPKNQIIGKPWKVMRVLLHVA
ncbi:unnamed protein product [Dovyalis caffra]|uniref:Uncharacterized protein n=1 Tax=Dovyalis caffra TaxID=77055 RepID=A0AAV1QXL1_9ROSI|nr:unnamed protein product [Dovyalis caffra]